MRTWYKQFGETLKVPLILRYKELSSFIPSSEANIKILSSSIPVSVFYFCWCNAMVMTADFIMNHIFTILDFYIYLCRVWFKQLTLPKDFCFGGTEYVKIVAVVIIIYKFFFSSFWFRGPPGVSLRAAGCAPLL